LTALLPKCALKSTILRDTLALSSSAVFGRHFSCPDAFLDGIGSPKNCGWRFLPKSHSVGIVG
jgi:hypothetical protein